MNEIVAGGWGLVNELFSTREIASGLWLSVAFVWVLTVPKVRGGLFDIAKLSMKWKIWLPLFFLAAYTVLVVTSLRYVGVWTATLVKETVFWYLLSGIAFYYSVLTQREHAGMFRRALVENLKITVILELLVGTYTFSLPGIGSNSCNGFLHSNCGGQQKSRF